jgi:hypothetical protein
MDLSDGRLGERYADVRLASVVAVVRPGVPVIYVLLPLVTVIPAAQKFRVERVQNVGVDRADLRLSDERHDVLGHEPPIRLERLSLQP